MTSIMTAKPDHCCTLLEGFCRRLSDPAGVILVAPSSEKAEGDASAAPSRRSFKPG